MRELTAYEQTILSGPVTEPRYLIDITLDLQMFLSTRGQVFYNDVDWQEGDIFLDQITMDGASLRIANDGYAYTSGALNGQYTRNPVKIYLHYPGDGVGGPVSFLMFDGQISATPDFEDWLTVQCIRTSPKRFPSVRIRQPFANHLPSKGQVVILNDIAYRIEG